MAGKRPESGWVAWDAWPQHQRVQGSGGETAEVAFMRVRVCVCVCVHSVVSDSLRPHALGSSVHGIIPPGHSIHGIIPARMLQWVAIPFSRGSSQPRDPTRVSCIADSLKLSHLGSPEVALEDSECLQSSCFSLAVSLCISGRSELVP